MLPSRAQGPVGCTAAVLVPPPTGTAPQGRVRSRFGEFALHGALQKGYYRMVVDRGERRADVFQDIEPDSYCNDFAWVEPEPEDRVLVYRGASVLAAVRPRDDASAGRAEGGSAGCAPDEHALDYPTYGMLEDAGAVGPDSAARGLARADGEHPAAFFLFTVGEEAYFRCETDDGALDALVEGVPDGEGSGPVWRFVPISELREHGSRSRAFAGFVGYEYDSWYAARRFCGRCGVPLVHDLVERMVRCPQCGCMEFPKLFPAVIVGIVDRRTDRVLVSRYAGREYKRYALIAGFCEMGETVEETVHREVKEEVGLAVKNLRYYKSQPWPPSSSLLLGFFCDLDGSDAITLDDHELEHAEWRDRDDLPADDGHSLTRDMMRVLRERGEERFPATS